ncbi:MAG: indole-3-glycerol phosphate synthase [Thermonema sp.]|jgi:indole-3-glycerol phosphate synthase|uniref:indole-3-glycerol phosphate synthase TrpC n=1 Tax=Thermonema TaxID=28194 RepID=UPI00068ED6AD|nr:MULTISPECIES: indole-3-glycerol phosphate synthase TrpC [Thermonema]GIV38633.1 MAG: indole-3-glycerol phosphate synthase [Thermonema sp.]
MTSTILDLIVMNKRAEVQARRKTQTIEQLSRKPLFGRATLSLKKKLLSAPFGIIAEFKRSSPSKGALRAHAKPQEIAFDYERAGAAGISILTDKPFFDGDLLDLQVGRSATALPVLRKDFVIDEYQLYEAKAYGADVVLLIAHILSAKEIRFLTQRAHDLGLEVLCEIHSIEDLDKAMEAPVDMIGVNNRNLKTFEVSLEHSKQLAAYIPEDTVRISESGLRTADDLVALMQHGYRGFLIGETFMTSPEPGESCRRLIEATRCRIKEVNAL